MGNAKKLKFVFQIARHGARSPLSPSYSRFYYVGPEELTPSGMRQQYLLGSYLRKKYIENDDPETEGFLSSSHDSNEWYVGSTHIGRTIESARYFMLGFYPPKSSPNKEYSPAAVYNNKAEHDTIHTTGNCPYLEEQYKKIHETPELWVKFDKYFRPKIYQKLMDVANNTEEGELDYLKAFRLGDAVESLVFEGVIDKNTFSESEWIYIERLQIPWIMNSFTPLGTKLVVSKLLNPIVELIDFKILGYWSSISKSPAFTGQEKFVHYSGHDTSMANVLMFLRPEDFSIDTLPYASTIAIELYQLEDEESFSSQSQHLIINKYDNYEVRVLFMDKALKLKHCKEIYCTLTEFMAYFKVHGLSPQEVTALCKQEFEFD